MTGTEFTIPGSTAAITGAGAGIGRQIADHLTSAGVDVVINDVSERALGETRDLLADNEGDIITLQDDASDPDAAHELVETTVDRFGSLDILVNNVGIAGPTKPLENIERQEFMETLEVNMGALFSTTKAAIPYLRRAVAGRVVNLSSMSGKRPLRDRTPYTTSKMGVLGFTRTLAVELADADVTVNAVCPGSVDGPRLDAVIEGQAKSQGRTFDSVEREFREVSPMSEFVTATDVADTVLYLCSDRARRVTGQDLNVTAGIVMY